MTKRQQCIGPIGFALVALLAIGAFAGCGGGGAKPVKADAVVVTYYYLPL